MRRILVLTVMWFAAVALAQAASPWPGSCIIPIITGQTINGTLAASSCSFNFGTDTANHYYTDVHSFGGTASQQSANTMNSTAVISLPSLTLPTSELTVNEFYHPAFNHYFITAYAEEAASLAAGNLPPWVPTGKTFKVWSGSGTNITNVWRFFSASFAPKSGHFYTNNAAEAQKLQSGNVWSMEASTAFYMMSSPAGTCPSGTMPLYRLYNNGQGGAPNHRYTIESAVRAQMIASGWIPEGNGADGVFACVPLSTSLPTPTGSLFQQNVMYYSNTALGLASGNVVNLDQLVLILGAGINSLLNTGATCPVATSVPPLANLDTLPSTLTLTFDFGNGCMVASDTAHATVAGKMVVSVNNAVLTDTVLSGTLAVTMTNVKLNGVLVANGGVSATFNVIANSSGATPTYSGVVTASLNNLQLPNNIGFNGTITLNLNTGGTTTVSTSVVSSPSNVLINFNNMTVVSQGDGSVLINTSAASTVGVYTVSISNVRINPSVCQTGAISGTVSFTSGGRTGVVTFNNTCNYTYAGP
jgi:hypothetical protein